MAHLATILMLAEHPTAPIGSIPVQCQHVEHAIKVFEYCIPEVQVMRHQYSDEGKVESLITKLTAWMHNNQC